MVSHTYIWQVKALHNKQGRQLSHTMYIMVELLHLDGFLQCFMSIVNWGFFWIDCFERSISLEPRAGFF